MNKQIKIIIFVAVVVVAFGVILALRQPSTSLDAQSADSKQHEAGILTSDPASYDFGTISMKNGKVNKSFKVVNISNNSVNLKKLYTSCMCTDASIKIDGQDYGPFGMPGMGITGELNKSLAPKQEAEIIATFDPNAHGPSGVGEIQRTITVEGDNGHLLDINFKANVTP